MQVEVVGKQIDLADGAVCADAISGVSLAISTILRGFVKESGKQK